MGIKASGNPQTGGNVLQVNYLNSLNPFVQTGSSFEIGKNLSSSDFYSFSATAGQTVTLAATPATAGSPLQMTLDSATGSPLATGKSVTNGNVGSFIENFSVPTTGTYDVVISAASGVPYSLVVTRNADFNSGANSTSVGAQKLGGTDGALGSVAVAGTKDYYSINLSAGEGIALQISTLGGGAASQFTDNLVPSFLFVSPAGTTLLTGTAGHAYDQLAATAGTYSIQVLGSSSTVGEYFLGITTDLTPPTVSITPILPNPSANPISSIQIVFNEPVTGMSLGDLSLTLAAGANLLTSAQTLTTSDNKTFTLNNLSSLTTATGTYTITASANNNITDQNGFPLATGASANFTIGTGGGGPAPEVAAVYVSGGNSWSSAFYQYLANAGLGNSLGYAIPGGANQLQILPWSDLTSIAIVFTQSVTVNTAQSGLALVGSTDLPAVPSLNSAAFQYNSATDTATWTFANPLTTDKFLLCIPAVAVTNGSGTALDGDWTNPGGLGAASTFPSGNGTAGGNFNFRFNVVPGDVNGDSVVTGADGTAVRLNLGQSTGSGGYSPNQDVDGDGSITTNDMSDVRTALLNRLPNTEPIAPFGGFQSQSSGSGTQSASGSTKASAPPTKPADATARPADRHPGTVHPLSKEVVTLILTDPIAAGPGQSGAAVPNSASSKNGAGASSAGDSASSAKKSPAAALHSTATIASAAAKSPRAVSSGPLPTADAATLAAIHDALLEQFDYSRSRKRVASG